MPQRCAVCDHPSRQEIDRILALNSGPLREIVEKYGIGMGPVWRHNQLHLPKTLVEAIMAERNREGRSLVSRIDRMACRVEKLLDDPKINGSAPQILAAVRELRPSLELLGRANRELAPPTVVAFLGEIGASGEAEVRNALELSRSSALASVEDIEADAVEALRMVLEQKPERRLAILEALSGGMASVAVIDQDEPGSPGDANGHGNGSRLKPGHDPAP